MNELDRLLRIGFLEGAVAGIILCAVWEDGKLLVGVTRRPLREVVAPYEEEIGRLRDELQTGAASIALRRSAHCMLAEQLSAAAGEEIVLHPVN